MPIVLDLVLIGVVVYDAFIPGDYPPIFVQVVLGLVPTALTLTSTLLVLRRLPG